VIPDPRFLFAIDEISRTPSGAARPDLEGVGRLRGTSKRVAMLKSSGRP